MIDLRAKRRIGALILSEMVIEWLAIERMTRPALFENARKKRRPRPYRLAELLPWNYSPTRKISGVR